MQILGISHPKFPFDTAPVSASSNFQTGIAVACGGQRRMPLNMADDNATKAERAPRKNLMKLAKIAANGGKFADLRIKNLSATGLAGVTDLRLQVGDAVTIEFKTGDIREAIIVRVAGTSVGMSFADTIEPEAVVAATSVPREPSAPFVLRRLHRIVADHRRPGVEPPKR
jgi:hypothetical protein